MRLAARTGCMRRELGKMTSHTSFGTYVVEGWEAIARGSLEPDATRLAEL